MLPDRFRCLIVGSSNCGKTHLLNRLLTDECFSSTDKFVVISKSIHQPIYQDLKEEKIKNANKKTIRKKGKFGKKSGHWTNKS